MRARLLSITVLAAAVVTIVAAGAQARPLSAPPRTPVPVAGAVYVDIFWPDGRTETVPAAAPGPPSAALAQATIAAQAAAEASPSALRRLSDVIAGASACSWAIIGPFKQSFSDVTVAASVSCTFDVYWVSGGLTLLRDGLPIGADYEGGGSPESPRNAVYFGVDGTCRAGKHGYIGALSYSAVSILGAAASYQHAIATVISC